MIGGLDLAHHIWIIWEFLINGTPNHPTCFKLGHVFIFNGEIHGFEVPQ